jgi:hypothetical protein
MKSILAFLPIVVLSITYVFILWKNNFKYNKWFWPISFFYLILIRSDDLFRPYTLCPDEEQWLICANSIIESPYNYVKYFLLFDFSRLFTILPLCLFSPITDYISYEHARILNLLIYFGIIFFIHKCADLFFQNNSEIPTILSAYLLMFFSLSRDYDFIAYNSELPAILLLIISCYLVLKKINRNKLDFAHMFIAGNLISSTINAKEQIFAISFFIGSCIVIYLWLNKKYFALLGYISGAITSVILLHAILFWFYSFGDYKMIIDTGYEYSKTAVFSKKNFVDNLKNLVDIVLLSRDYIILSLIVTLSYFLYVKN